MFYDDVSDQIALAKKDSIVIPNQGPKYIYSNIGRSRLMVLQLNNDFRFDALRFTLGVGFTKSFATTSLQEQIIYRTPDFHYFEGNASVRYDVTAWKGGIALFCKYTGSQPQIGSIEGGAIFGDKLKSYSNIDASVEKRFWKERILVTAGVRNLTNTVILGAVGGAGTGAVTGGGHTPQGGQALSTGRSFFTSLRVQLGK